VLNLQVAVGDVLGHVLVLANGTRWRVLEYHAAPIQQLIVELDGGGDSYNALSWPAAREMIERGAIRME
jgi:hypothetical protein